MLPNCMGLQLRCNSAAHASQPSWIVSVEVSLTGEKQCWLGPRNARLLALLLSTCELFVKLPMVSKLDFSGFEKVL